LGYRKGGVTLNVLRKGTVGVASEREEWKLSGGAQAKGNTRSQVASYPSKDNTTVHPPLIERKQTSRAKAKGSYYILEMKLEALLIYMEHVC